MLRRALQGGPSPAADAARVREVVAQPMPTTVALLLVSLLASTLVRGETPPATTPSASHQSMPDLGKGAEEVAAQLRELTESLSDTGPLVRLEAEVAATTSRAAERWSETGALLQNNLRPSTLDSLESSWRAIRSQLDDAMDQIDARVRRRTADLETLTRLRESWDRALDLARKANAPASVQERAQSTVAAIEAARPAIEQRHAHMLVLQDAVSRGLQTCDDALARIDDARRQTIERMFVRQEPPVWRIGLASIDPRHGEVSLAADLATKVESVRIYAQAYGLRLVLSGLLILACVILLRRWRVQLAGPARRSDTDGRTASTVQAPYSAGILLGLLISFPLRETPPFAFRQLLLVIATAAAV